MACERAKGVLFLRANGERCSPADTAGHGVILLGIECQQRFDFRTQFGGDLVSGENGLAFDR